MNNSVIVCENDTVSYDNNITYFPVVSNVLAIHQNINSTIYSSPNISDGPDVKVTWVKCSASNLENAFVVFGSFAGEEVQAASRTRRSSGLGKEATFPRESEISISESLESPISALRFLLINMLDNNTPPCAGLSMVADLSDFSAGLASQYRALSLQCVWDQDANALLGFWDEYNMNQHYGGGTLTWGLWEMTRGSECLRSALASTITSATEIIGMLPFSMVMSAFDVVITFVEFALSQTKKNVLVLLLLYKCNDSERVSLPTPKPTPKPKTAATILPADPAVVMLKMQRNRCRFSLRSTWRSFRR